MRTGRSRSSISASLPGRRVSHVCSGRCSSCSRSSIQAPCRAWSCAKPSRTSIASRPRRSQLIQQRVEARNSLTVLLDGTPWPISDEPQNMNDAHSPTLDAGVPAQLLGRRPDLRAAELRLRESLSQIKVTRVSYYPAITLTGSVRGTSDSLSSVLAHPVETLGAGLALPFHSLERGAAQYEDCGG